MILAAGEPLRTEEVTPIWRGASQDQIAYFIDKDVPDRCRCPMKSPLTGSVLLDTLVVIKLSNSQ